MATSYHYVKKPPDYTQRQYHSLSGIEVDYFDLCTKRYLWPTGINAVGRQMLFTGPGGVRDRRVKRLDDTVIGIGPLSPEHTNSLKYLYRPDWKNPPQLYRKHERVGGVGWGVPKHSDSYPALTGHQTRRTRDQTNQVARGVVNGRCEDMWTHRLMCPWYPISDVMKRPNTCPAVYIKPRRTSSSHSSGSQRSSSSSLSCQPITPSSPKLSYTNQAAIFI